MAEGPVSLAEARRRRQAAGEPGSPDDGPGGGGPWDGGPGGGAPPAPDFDACPVTPLGREGGVYWYLSPAGEFRTLTERAHTEAGITSLFDGDGAWLAAAFPSTARNAGPGDWSLRSAREFLMRGCALAGFFDPVAAVRGAGVWRAGPAGAVVHAGDAVLLPDAGGSGGGEWRPAGFRHGGHVYPASAPEPRPADVPASAADGHRLLGLLGQWRWRDPPAAPRMLLGWIGAGMVSGLLDWRPHVWVTGDLGTGKSTLEKLLSGLLASARAIRIADPSAASVRNKLGGAARPVMINEIEPQAGSGMVQAVVRLARLASTDDEAPISRAGLRGEVLEWRIAACFYLTSIFAAALLPQDRSRISVLNLDELPTGPGSEAAMRAVRKAVPAMIALGPAFRARLIGALPRLRANIAAYESAIMARRLAGRVSDQLGTMLACADLLLADDATTAATAADVLDGVAVEAFSVGPRESSHWLCLTHLQSASVGQGNFDTGGKWMDTLGEVIDQALGPDATTAVGRALRLVGVSVQYWAGPEWESEEARAPHGGKPPASAAARKWVVVADHHQGLARLFAGSDWEGGIWRQAFERLPGAQRRPAAGGVVNFGGVRGRGTWLPAELFGDRGVPWESRDEGAPVPPELRG